MLKKTRWLFVGLLLAAMVSFSTVGEAATLEMLSAYIDVEKPVDKSIVCSFEQHHPSVKIKHSALNFNQLVSKLVARAAGRKMPDIYMSNAELMVKLFEMGMVAPLNNLVGKNHIAKLYKPCVDAFTYKGKVLVLPVQFHPYGILYRADMFEEVGIQSLPETWPELIDVLEKLKAQDLPGFALLGSKTMSASRRFTYIVWSYGKRLLKETPNGKWVTEIDTPEAVQAFEMYKKLYEYAPPGVLAAGYLEGTEWLAVNKASMMLTGPHSIGQALKGNPELNAEDFGQFPIPRGPVEGGRRVASLKPIGYSISKTSEHKEVAAEFLRFYTSAENQLGFPKYCGRIPVNKLALEWAKQKYPFIGGALETAKYAVLTPKHPAWTEAQRAVQVAMQAVLTGTPPEKAAQVCAEEVRRAIERAE